MKNVIMLLFGLLLVTTFNSCKKEEEERRKELIVSTIAGAGAAGYVDGIGQLSAFNNPNSIVCDAAGNIFVTDTYNQRIRKVTPEGVVTTFAGSGASGYADGTGTAAVFNNPQWITIDASGNLYVSDTDNSCIRKITQTGVVTTIAGVPGSSGYIDGPGIAAQFDRPQGVAVDAANNVYVADFGNNRIRKISSAGIVSTLVGDGSADWGSYRDGPVATATMGFPHDIAVDAAGNIFVLIRFAGGSSYNAIRKISPGGIVSTYVGGDFQRFRGNRDGLAAVATFQGLSGMGLDPSGNLYITDYGNTLIRKVSADGNTVSTYAGTVVDRRVTVLTDVIDGPAMKSLFTAPVDIACDHKGNVYVSDKFSMSIRKISWEDVPKTAEEMEKSNWNKPKNWK